MKKSISRIHCCFIFLFISISIPYQSVFGDSNGDSQKIETIREMQENASDLKKKEEQLKFQWTTFQIGANSLGDILGNLPQEKALEVSNLLSKYQAEKKKAQVQLDNAISQDLDTYEYEKSLLVLKKDFYTQLLPFVPVSKQEDFKSFISHDVEYNEKSKKINTEIQVIESKKKERIEEIKEKIEDNQKELKKRIREKVAQKVKTVLDGFVSREQFQALDNADKIRIFEKIQGKVDELIVKYKESPLDPAVAEDKILLLEIVRNIISSYIKQWK